MIYNVFCVHDSKAEAFLPPFILPNDAMAKRVFADCINSDSHQFGQNPADYTLFALGQFDDHSGEFMLQRAKQSLGNGVEFRSPDHPISPELGNGKATDESFQALSDESPIRPGASGENSEEQL